MIPKVTIVMATYKPNVDFFRELLISINNQTYRNLELLIRDDSGDIDEFNRIVKIVTSIVTNLDFKIEINKNNIGSNRTFEILAKEAGGQFIAFCDQDDIWEELKIEKLINRTISEKLLMCYSDLSIIDQYNNKIADSFKDINKRIKHIEGFGNQLFDFFLRRNCVTGCTMLIDKKLLDKAIPFCHDFYVHDHWLALIASSSGRIGFINEALVKYRIHGNNQIGASVLSGISDKTDYLKIKLVNERNKLYALLNIRLFNDSQNRIILDQIDWVENRVKLFNNPLKNSLTHLFKYFTRDIQLTIFETSVAILPSNIGSILINRFKKK